MMRQIIQLPVADIAPRPNPIRPVDDDYAMAIAVSIGEAGQLQPILVRPRVETGGQAYELVAGGHLLRAAVLADRDYIDAEVRDMTDVEARIAEIDENAVRKELSALDFALSMAERKRLYDQAYPETARGKKTGKGNQHFSLADNLSVKRADGEILTFTKDAAKKTGFTDRSIRRSVELANCLSPDLIALLRGTKLADNAAALKKLTRLPVEQRRAVAEAMAAGEAKSINGALEKRGYAEPAVTDPALQLTARFTDILSRTSAGQRREWLLMILRAGGTNELPALANALADRLSAKGQKLVFEALSAVVAAHDEEAA